MSDYNTGCHNSRSLIVCSVVFLCYTNDYNIAAHFSWHKLKIQSVFNIKYRKGSFLKGIFFSILKLNETGHVGAQLHTQAHIQVTPT